MTRELYNAIEWIGWNELTQVENTQSKKVKKDKNVMLWLKVDKKG